MTDTPDLITDPKQRLMLIVQAIPKLDAANPSQFTKDGKPTTLVLSSLTGIDVSASERDEVWAAHLEALGLEKCEDDPAVDAGPAAASFLWSVRDKNAKSKPRRHTPIEGGPEYLLTATTPVPMPRAHAVKFLLDPAFIVCNEVGQHIMTLPASESTATGVDRRAALGEDEVVARVSELTLGALLIRCQRMPGSDHLTAQTQRHSLEYFLIEAKKRQAAVAKNPVLAVEDDDPESYSLDLAGKVA